jgi:hypothetical protein
VRRAARLLAPLLLCAAARAGGPADQPLSVGGKALFHATNIASAWFAPGVAAYSGILQWRDSPPEWGQGWRAYGKRAASAAGASGVRNVFAFALDSSLHEDPRYSRASHGPIMRRLRHAIGYTFVTRTDSGGRRFATWRFGSAAGAAFVSNFWYPDRLNNFPEGVKDTATTIGGDVLLNIAKEFWPDLRRKLFRH